MKVEERSNAEGLSALYSGTLQNLAMVQAADNAVETKAIGVVTLSLAIVVLMADNTTTWHILPIIGIMVLGASLILALLCMRIRSYFSATVNIRDKYPGYLTKDSVALLKQLIADAESSYTDSENKLSNKAELCRWALRAFIIGALVCIASFHTSQ